MNIGMNCNLGVDTVKGKNALVQFVDEIHHFVRSIRPSIRLFCGWALKQDTMAWDPGTRDWGLG